jgi:glycosyltransferase involved in cell wall biosynthesis
MRIAIVAPPFIAVPPKTYGGTELVIANLAEGLSERGHQVVVYANGESTVRCEVRSLFEAGDWPPRQLSDGTLRGIHHAAWAFEDIARADFDVVHLNDASSVPLTRFLDTPAVHTLHHPHEEAISELYLAHPRVLYVAISQSQRGHEPMPWMSTIHHGIRLSNYRLGERKREYLSFLGRIAPIKGTHHALEVARRTGIPLKLAGEIQPMFQPYWEQQIKPHVDGRLIEYVGQVDLALKAELLAHSTALLFPIEWAEPLGLVMLEAMASGTPVLAFPGGSVREVVCDGTSGWVCRDLDELTKRARDPAISPESCRQYVSRRFSLELMVERYERVYGQAIDRPHDGLSATVDKTLQPLALDA